MIKLVTEMGSLKEEAIDGKIFGVYLHAGKS